MKSKTPYKKTRRRLGRGIGSTVGKTSGRGMKGQYSRTGSKARLYSEGGQNTFIRRLPKRGFVHATKKIYEVINFSTISKIDKDELTPHDFVEAGVVKKIRYGIKILAKGTLDKKVVVHAHAFSDAAKEKIESLGGKAVVIDSL